MTNQKPQNWLIQKKLSYFLLNCDNRHKHVSYMPGNWSFQQGGEFKVDCDAIFQINMKIFHNLAPETC